MIRGLARIGGLAVGMTLSLASLLEKEDILIIERASLLFSNQAEFSMCFVRHTDSNLFMPSS